MMEKEQQVRLTSAEIAQIWSQYMNDSASVCILTYFLEKAEDPEIKPIILHALELSNAHIQKIITIFMEENHNLPHGFTLEEDVDITAPRLYSDSYVLNFIHNMSKLDLTAYTASLAVSVRADITEYYMKCLTETMELYKMTKDLLLSKGIYIRSPYFANIGQFEFVEKQSFTLDLFEEKRPLTALEVSNLYSNFQRNTLGVATLIGFSQVSKIKEVKKYQLKLVEVGKKHSKSFEEKLEKSNLPSPLTWDTEVTESISYTFSDRLMMFYTSALTALSVGYYGTAIGQSPRIDLAAMYNKLILEVQLLSENGAYIMIKNKWLEQPPLAPNRKNLAK